MADYTGTNLGGGYQGISPVQTINNYKSSENVMFRRVLRDGWNTQYATGVVNGKNRAITPFRAVNNIGDFLARHNVACEGPNQVHGSRIITKRALRNHINTCDSTGIPITSCNVKFVPDSSEYVRFKKLQAMNRNYNDTSNGGSTNSDYVNIMAIRR
jgi:hypothetical protein